MPPRPVSLRAVALLSLCFLGTTVAARAWLGYSMLSSLLLGGFIAYLPTMADGAQYSGRRAWPAFQRLAAWRWLTRWMPMRIAHAPRLDDGKQYIFCAFPHGIITANHFMTMTNACGFFERVHGGERRDLAASVLFIIPFLRDFLLWLGNVDASRGVARRLLSKGYSTMIYVGGEREQIMTSMDDARVVVADRKGFARLALEFGVPLVPVYVFGESRLYHTYQGLQALQLWLVRKLRVAVPLAVGWKGTPLPRREALHMVVGEPVPVPRVRTPTLAQVDALHAQFVTALRALFDRHKRECGYGQHKGLEVGPAPPTEPWSRATQAADGERMTG